MEKPIATLNPSNVLDTVAKLFRVLEKEGVEWPHYQRPINFRVARQNLAEYLKFGCQKPNGRSLATTTAMASPFFANEEMASNYGYPQGYAVKPVCEQLVELVKHFSGLDTSSVLACSKELPALLPQGAEGWFAVPRWEKVAGTYNQAVENVLDLIGKTRSIHNYRTGKLGPKYLRLSERTAVALQMLGKKQKGDFLLIPAQFGLTHRGRSVRRVREIIGNSNEFGVGSFIVGCMILSHPERLIQWEHLHIECPGDEHSSDSDGWFDGVPVFRFYDGAIRFDMSFVDRAHEGYGSASAFLPHYLVSGALDRFGLSLP